MMEREKRNKTVNEVKLYEHNDHAGHQSSPV